MGVLPREDDRDHVLRGDNPDTRGVDAVPEELPALAPEPLVHSQPGVVARVGVLQVKNIKADLDCASLGHGDGPGVGEGLRADQQKGVKGALYHPLTAGHRGPVQKLEVGDKPGPGPRGAIRGRVELDPESVGCCQVSRRCGAAEPKTA